MPTRDSKPPEVIRQTVFDAIATTLQLLATARGLLIEAKQADQLRSVARELEYAKARADEAYQAACRLYQQVGDAEDRLT